MSLVEGNCFISSRYSAPSSRQLVPFATLNLKAPEEAEKLLSGMTTAGKAALLPQYIAGLAVSLGGMSMGSMLGWSSPTQTSIQEGDGIFSKFPVSESEFTYVSSIVNIGAMVGALVAGPICDIIGRRTVIIASSVPCILSWCLLIWSENVYMLLAARFLIGLFGSGVFSCASPMYTNEISQKEIRGILGTFFQLQVNIGILFSYIVGAYCTAFVLSVLCVIIPIVLGVSMLFMPESPYYFLIKKDETKARAAMTKLRGKQYDVSEEISASQKILQTIEEEKVPMMKAFSTVEAKKGLIIGIVLMALQQFSGINAVIFYASDIFQAAGSTIDSNICSIIVGSFCVIGTALATQIIDRLGRRPLLLASASVMAVAHFFLGLYFYLKSINSDVVTTVFFQYLPLVALCIFIILFSVGLGPIPWMFVGEILPANILAPASSIACVTNWLSSFIVTSIFSPLKNSIGNGPTFWVFGVICALGAVFTFILVPETKGKELKDIQAILRGDRPEPKFSSSEEKKPVP